MEIPNGKYNGQVETKLVTIKTALKASKIIANVPEIYPTRYSTTIKTAIKILRTRSIVPIFFFITHVFLR